MFPTALTLALLALPQNAISATPSIPTSWASALSKAKTMVSKMTLEERNNITYGQSSHTGCSGVSGSVPRLNFPGFCLNDAAAGVRQTDLVNAYAAGISVGASWNADLAKTRASFMGKEFKAKGANVALGPVVGPLGRVATGGRNWEGFAADPYLAGKLAAVTVEGLQESVIASVKHFIAYEQETNRQPLGNISSVSANVNDQDMHELYLWPFVDAVYSGAACVMCSYNRINETYACENAATLNGLLKDELAFEGFVVSDWSGQHTGVKSAIAGLDMAMPNSPYWQGTLSFAVQNGSLPASRLKDMATRIVAAWYYLGQDLASFPSLGVGIASNLLAPHAQVDARDPKSKPSLLQSAIEGHVLVKNTKNALPLQKPKMLSLYGYDAVIPKVNYPDSASFSLWGYGLQSENVTLLQLAQILGGNLSGISYLESANLGTLIVGGGSGSNTASYWSDPYSAMQQQAYTDDTFLLWDFENTNPNVNPVSDACLVFINEEASEALDRPALADPNSDTLVTNVASKCTNTIVVIHNAGIRLVDAWIENPNVTAVIFAHLPGQDSGRALVSVLYGKVSPSGRLPYTVAKNELYYGGLLFPAKNPAGSVNPQANFSSPDLIDYQYFLANSFPTRYPFGYGLTYSTFSYSNLVTKWLVSSSSISKYPPSPTTKIPGGIASLFTTIANVTMKLKNTGKRTAAEVPQLYIQFPGESKVHVLRGFTKEELKAGQSVMVSFPLTRRDLSRWDVGAQKWAMQKGTYGVFVGSSVEDITLTGSLVR